MALVMDRMFSNCVNWEGSAGVSSWNVAFVSSIVGLFENLPQFDADMSGFGVSGMLKDLSYAWAGCSSFTGTGLDQNGWLTMRPSDLAGAFMNCTSFSGDGIGQWNVQAVSSMRQTFDGCENAIFNDWDSNGMNQIVWNTANVLDFYATFRDCKNSRLSDIGRWNLKKATTLQSMFENAVLFNPKLPTSSSVYGFDFGEATTTEAMFKNCFEFNPDRDRWYSEGTNMRKVTSRGRCSRGAANGGRPILTTGRCRTAYYRT
jgi:hypothetical protein